FFSSRRRHTRLQGDWSSDVCSSDLDRASLSSGKASRGSPKLANKVALPLAVETRCMPLTKDCMEFMDWIDPLRDLRWVDLVKRQIGRASCRERVVDEGVAVPGVERT